MYHPILALLLFFFLLPFQRAIKFYDQHFIDPNEQYHTEVGQLTTLSFSWPDSYCGNLGGHYWCRLAWQCLSVLQDMMLSSAKIKNNINKQVKKPPKAKTVDWWSLEILKVLMLCSWESSFMGSSNSSKAKRWNELIWPQLCDPLQNCYLGAVIIAHTGRTQHYFP